ncbi:MAG: hypothetical protein DYG98_00650 [Haliscomenobacteraceae bacterium CHB4]|nr:hypothetical protein [Saprospiraceae bacterium]MCE7921544.1 hypothetical protein [Haliscomenobacteraceae bacterium CHB4]
MKTHLIPVHFAGGSAVTENLRVFFMALFVSLFCVSGLAQSKIDSFERALPAATGNKRAELLYQLSWEYRFSDKEKALRYGEEGLQLGKSLKDTAAIASSLNSLSETYLNFGDYDLAEKITREELPYARALLPLSKNLLGALTRLGTIHYRRGKLDSALVYQLEVQREAEKIKKPEIIGVATLNLGLTYMDLKRFDEALQYYNAALQAFQTIHFSAGIGACYVNIAETLRSQKKYEAALEAALKGETVLRQSGNKLHLGYLYGIMADVYTALKNTPKRLEYAQKALSLAEENKDELSVSQNQAKLGRIFLEKGDLDKAKTYFDASLQLAEKTQHKSMLLENYTLLRDWHLLRGEFEQANLFDEKYRSGMDSVFNVQMAEKVADSRTKYETEKKEAEIARQKLELLNQRLWIFGLFGGLTALVVLGLFFYYRARQHQKAELAAAVIREQRLGLNAVIEAQESERKRIAKDLHDGIAQELVALKLGFDALGRRIGKVAPEETARFVELNAQLDTSCTEVRNIAHVMMPPTLEQHGLAPSLELLLRNTAQPAGLQVRFDSRDLPDQLDEKTQIGLYRILQELLNNVVKHARATKVLIEVYLAGNQLIMRVEDDGQGFDFETARQKGTMGVLNILSRVSTLGGEFYSERAMPQGTVSVVRVPVDGRR